MRTLILIICLSACALILSAKDPASVRRLAPAKRSPALALRPAARAAENECLSCHGPFDKIIEASAKYVAPSGETGSPHRYVPHDSKKVEEVPECKNCHKAHSLDPLPSKGSIDVSKVGIQWCYEVCHHERNLKSCKECHP